MSSGKVHDRAILITTPLVAGTVYYFAPNYTAEIAIAHLFGGLFLSPDLDLVSRPYKRWSVLKFYKDCRENPIPLWVGMRGKAGDGVQYP